MNEEQEIKKNMSVREQPDSMEIAIGTPSKGDAIKLKCYFDASMMDDSGKSIPERKIKGILNIRAELIKKLGL